MIGKALFFRGIKRWLVPAGSLFLVAFLGGNVAVVEYTTQPQFCASCHNMVPFVESWKRSSHKNVGCIECHYEPGILETVEVKYKALSQLAKYATRTAGTKPWAEVTDASCMRSGCHETRLLTGRIPFGDTFFDHRPHLTENRPGKRLHCTTCHSQVDQETHISVSKSTCFTCHFTEGERTWTRSPDRGDSPDGAIDACVLCHEAPAKELTVEGQPFSHAAFVDKHDVDCRECHDDVTRGTGAVSIDRCKQCHGEVEYLERFEQPTFLHQSHVSDHKVECFECHGEIKHGLAPLEKHLAAADTAAPAGHGKAAGDGSCASCHGSSHSIQAAMFSGQLDGEDLPSRMFETRVSCRACHREEAVAGQTVGQQHPPSGARMPRATEVGCYECHGVAFAGMLGAWSASTATSLAELDGLAAQAAALPRSEDPQVAATIERHLADATRRLDLVRKDKSGGAHNLALTQRLLEKARDELGRGLALLGRPAPSVQVGPRIATELDCTTACHSQLDQGSVVPWEGRSFSHAAHLVSPGTREKVGDCSACHETKTPSGDPGHGRRTVTQQDCAQCHHEPEAATACSTCHEGPAAWLAGTTDQVASPPASAMEDLGCADCHEATGAGERWSRDRAMRSCNGCHEGEDDVLAAFDAAAKDLQRAWAELGQRARLAEVRADQRALGAEQLQALARARRLMRHAADGGLMHNQPLSKQVLDEARAELTTVLGGGE